MMSVSMKYFHCWYKIYISDTKKVSLIKYHFMYYINTSLYDITSFT